MASNPLQQYFRQPKVFLTLPSHGIYNTPEAITGDPERLPIFGMTGMDEIILKTPDALLTGESTVRVIQSCCPGIANGWEVSNLDVDALLVAIRIATYGNILNTVNICSSCGTENSYEIEVDKFLEHFAVCQFDGQVVINDLTIRIRPLTYKQVTDFNLENFALQKRLVQASELTNQDERNTIIAAIYKDLGALQNRVMITGIEQVETPAGVVTEHAYIKEWIENSDKTIFDAVKEKINENNDAWRIPTVHVKCESCGAENHFDVNLDQSSFFANA